MEEIMKQEEFLVKLAQAFSTQRAQIALNSTPGSLPGWDSLGSINLITLIQDEFDLKLSMDELAGLNSVADIVNMLKAKGVELSA
jgi:acyl carrier protein